MKLSFTTLGCPDWDLDTIITNAVKYGFDGIDFRGCKNEMNIYKLPEFSDNVEETRKKLESAGLQISCFSSSVHLFSTEKLQQNLSEIEQYARLCQIFDCSYIRVFGGSIGNADRSLAIQTVIEHTNKMVEIARKFNVKLLLETHDDWTACQHVKAIMDVLDREAAAVLWDVHHPYRTLGEKPEDTWKELGDRIEYTHWKDSRTEPENDKEFHYCLTGKGDIPLTEIYEICSKNHFDGWFTFEWEKRWHPEIEEPDIALPQYVQFMRSLGC
jgi:sugar phosphate isomerase/epimerase